MIKPTHEDVNFCIKIMFLYIFALVMASLGLSIATHGYEGIEYNNRRLLVTAFGSLIQIAATGYILRSEKIINFSNKGILKNAKIIILVYIAVLAFSSALETLLLLLKMDQTRPWDTTTSNNGPLVFVVLVVLAPIAEELIFRGAIFGRLRKNNSFFGAAIVSSTIFAFTHGSAYADINALLIGICLCLAYEATGNLVVSMIVHSANNLLVFLLSDNSRITVLPDKTFLSILLLVVYIAIAVTITLIIYKKDLSIDLHKTNE